MWAFRRFSNPLKSKRCSIGFSQASCSMTKRSSYLYDNAIIIERLSMVDPSPFAKRLFSSAEFSQFFLGKYNFSSEADTKSSNIDDDLDVGFADTNSRNIDDDLDDGFSELESPHDAGEDDSLSGEDDNLSGEDDDGELTSGTRVEEDEDNDSNVGVQNELDLSDKAGVDVNEKRSPNKRASSALLRAILVAPGTSVHNVLDKWVDEGNVLDRATISNTMLNLRKRRMYGRALQFSEWLESSKTIDFSERDYASRLDLIFKVRGLQKAESYIAKIPQCFRTEIVYRTFLANCVMSLNGKKAEEVFNKMKDLGFPITTFAYNQLLLLYKRTDKKKIADVLLLMEKENVKPSIFTYKLLIDVKGQSNDISGMEQIVETMKSEGIEPDLATQVILVKHYASGGLKDKAEAVLKEIESIHKKDIRWSFRTILPLYATLGKADEVNRLWTICEPNPRLEECMGAIEAWGKLQKIDEAEAIFERMSKTWKLSSKHYSVLLKVYANQKMVEKGKDLVKQMARSDVRIGPLTWDAVVKLYVDAGEVEKADSILHKAAEQSPMMKPMFSSYLAIMEQYAKRGDIANTEKIFHEMRQKGYEARLRQFHSLIQAYVNAKAPAYGIRERMKADNVFPNKSMAGMLTRVDAFRKKPASLDFLD